MAAPNEATPMVADPPILPAKVESDGAPRTRLCGRCRKVSDRNPADPPSPEADWWLCPPCRDALIGGVGRGRQP